MRKRELSNGWVTVGGGYREDMTSGWPGSSIQEGSQKLLTLPELPPLFPQSEWFARTRCERVMCCWDHLGSICDWTQYRPLEMFKGFCWRRRDLPDLCPHKTSLMCKFPHFAYEIQLLIWSGLLLFWSLLALCVKGASFRFYPENSQGFNPSFKVENNSLASQGPWDSTCLLENAPDALSLDPHLHSIVLLIIWDL